MSLGSLWAVHYVAKVCESLTITLIPIQSLFFSLLLQYAALFCTQRLSTRIWSMAVGICPFNHKSISGSAFNVRQGHLGFSKCPSSSKRCSVELRSRTFTPAVANHVLMELTSCTGALSRKAVKLQNTKTSCTVVCFRLGKKHMSVMVKCSQSLYSVFDSVEFYLPATTLVNLQLRYRLLSDSDLFLWAQQRVYAKRV